MNRKSVKVSYSIKSDDGFVVERTLKFVSVQDAFVYVKLLKQNVNVVGKPFVEFKQ